MEGVHNSLTWTQSDAIAEAKSRRIVRERIPPDYLEKVSRYLESSVGQGRQDEVPHEQAAADSSDSGDSLFITQTTVPEAVRSGKRQRKLRSDPKSPRDLEGSESDTSSSSSPSHGRSKTHKARRRKKSRLPKYSFPFVSERKWSTRATLLPVKQNISLHNYAMGGFFKCVRELSQHQSGGDVESSLPTIDMEEEYIYPLSEKEDEGSDDDDIKIVERKRFVAPSKAKSQQSWCNQSEQQSSRKAAGARQETSHGRQQKTLHNRPAEASILRATPVAKRQRNDERVTSDGNFLAQAETPNTKRYLTQGSKKIHFQQEETEEELCTDSDATICEPHKPQRSPKQYTQEGRRASTTVPEPETDVLHTANLTQTGQSEDEPDSQSILQSLPDFESDTNNNGVCNETRVKRGGKKEKDVVDHEIVEEERSQSQKGPEGLHAASSVTVETPSLFEDNGEEPPASQTNDELEFNEINCIENSLHDDTIVGQEERDIPNSKQKKKKRKKDKSAAENVRQEVDGNLESDVRIEDSGFSVGCNLENGGKEKKKKKKKGKTSEDAELLQSSAVTEPLIDDAEPKKKKKKRKKERAVTEECGEQEASTRTLDLPPVSAGEFKESGVCLENTASSQETLESGYVKRKKHKKKQTSSSVDAAQHGEEGVDVSFSNDAAAFEESTEVALKKTKKKKKTTSGEMDISDTPEENGKVKDVDDNQKTNEGPDDQNAELVTKKKKKKKMSEPSSRNISEDNVAQSDNSASVRKKEKKRTSSFLVADTEETNAQTHEEQNSADAHVWGAEKRAFTANDFQTGSAEIAGNTEQSDDGFWKKKKKKKRKMSVEGDSVEEDHKCDFKEPSKTCQSALPDTTDTEVKRKKKRKGIESELVTLTEKLESAADAGHPLTDEAVVLKKKKKKKCEDKPCQSPPAATEVIESEKSLLYTSSSVSPKRKGKHLTFPLVAKGKHGSSVEISHDNHTSDYANNETLHMTEEASPKKKKKMNMVEEASPKKKKMNMAEEASPKKKKKMNIGEEASPKKKKEMNIAEEASPKKKKEISMAEEASPKKKKKIKSTDNVVKSLIKSTELERKKQSVAPNITSSGAMLSETSIPDLSSSDQIMKKKHSKVKRALHNPSAYFLTD